MHVIRVRNVHQALPKGLQALCDHGEWKATRNGNAVVMPTPVTTVYLRPCERVIFWPERDANPFFHLFESLWMLAGRNDVAWLDEFLGTMKKYSDDGKTYHGAYGFRWRNHFSLAAKRFPFAAEKLAEWFSKKPTKLDQISQVIAELNNDWTSRRVVMGMWDPSVDLVKPGKDVPCNLNIIFKIRKLHNTKHLDMIVNNRSNDAILGAYGANAVHMSVLQEYIARNVNADVGTYYQVSGDFHAYEESYAKLELLPELAEMRSVEDDLCPYTDGSVRATELIDSEPPQWDVDLAHFMQNKLEKCDDIFFTRTAIPMLHAYRHYKNAKVKNLDVFTEVFEILDQMPVNSDWKLACQQWMQRRKLKWLKQADDGVQHAD
jgi:thymidylate synthase